MDPLYKVKMLVSARNDQTEGNTYAHSIQNALYKLVDLYPEVEVEDVFSIERHDNANVTVTAIVSLYTIADDKFRAFCIAEDVIRSIAIDDDFTISSYETGIVQCDEPLMPGWDRARIWQDVNADEITLTHAEYRDAYWKEQENNNV